MGTVCKREGVGTGKRGNTAKGLGSVLLRRKATLLERRSYDVLILREGSSEKENLLYPKNGGGLNIYEKVGKAARTTSRGKED